MLTMTLNYVQSIIQGTIPCLFNPNPLNHWVVRDSVLGVFDSKLVSPRLDDPQSKSWHFRGYVRDQDTCLVLRDPRADRDTRAGIVVMTEIILNMA